jgi:hypothetical protein
VSGWSLVVPSVIAAAFLVLAIVLFAVPASMRRSSDARPLLRRPALVVVRRSEMSMDGQTNYYFTLRFDDGSEGEFQRPGLGTMYERWPTAIPASRIRAARSSSTSGA